MADLVPSSSTAIAPAAERVAMADEAPDLEALFSFAREAELRVQTLRMTIEDHLVTARGPETVTYEIQLRHPGHARVTTRRGAEPMSRDYDVWLSDGESATTYQARSNVVSVRRLADRVAGSDQPGLPPFARQYVPRTRLPAGSLPEAFIHPHGLFRSVLVPFSFAIIIAYVLAPVVNRMARPHVGRAHMPRGVAVILCYVALVLVFVIFFVSFLPRLSADIVRFGREAPRITLSRMAFTSMACKKAIRTLRSLNGLAPLTLDSRSSSRDWSIRSRRAGARVTW